VPIPTDTPPPTATPTQEKLVIGESDVDGDDGNDFLRGSSERNEGRVILLPGFEQSEVGDTVVFRDRIVFRVEVFDTRAGTHDGAGIQEVRFQIVSDEGEVVHERTERVAGYCVFGGGEPGCNVLSLSQQPSYWPESGLEIRSGGYQANIDIIPEDGDQTQWRWSFLIELPGAASEAPPGAAHTTRSTRAADLS
jgi:hypothetical protein